MDTNIAYANTLSIGSTAASLAVGQLPGGTGTTGGYGNTITFANIAENVTGSKVLTINGIQGTTASEGYSVAFTSVNVGGIGTQTASEPLGITNNLPITGSLILGSVTNNSTVAGTNLLTLAGSGVITITGDITDSTNTGVLTGLTYSGSGFLNLTGTAATNYSGGFKVSAGTVRANTRFSLGTGSITLGGGTLEIRNDSSVTYTNPISLSASTTVTVGQSPGGTGATGGYGNTVTLSGVTPTATGFTLTFAGIAGSTENDGYNVHVQGAVNANVAAVTVTNNLSLPGTLTIDSVNDTGTTAGTNLLTFSGGGLTYVNGDILNSATAGVKTGISYVGTTGTLVLAGTAATNYSGGLTVGNTTNTGMQGTLIATTPFSLGAAANVVTLKNATLDFRSDSNVAYSNPINIDSTFNVGLNADRQIGGTGSGNTVTLNGLVSYTGSTQARYLFITSGDNYNFNFAGGITSSVVATDNELVNNSSGLVSIASFSSSGATATTQKFAGLGNITFNGNITQGTGALTVGIGGTTNGGLVDLSAVNLSNPANPYSGGLTFFGASTARIASPLNLGAAGNLINFSVGGATLQVRDNGPGNNGTLAFGNPITLSAVNGSHTIDIGNNGSNTGNTIAFGAVNNSAGITTPGNTLTVNGANGYGVSFTTFTLPNGTGQNTTLVANVPVTITGNVINSETGFGAGNFDTLLLDGGFGGTISGSFLDATGASLTAGGLTKLLKQGTGTWTLSAANSNLGLTTVISGILKNGVNNGISTASGQGLLINATGAGVTATVDLNGKNQTLQEGSNALTGHIDAIIELTGTTANSTPVLTGVGSTLFLTGATPANGDIFYTGNGAGGLISVSTLDLGSVSRTFNVADSTATITDLTISSNLQNVTTISKTGAGALLLNGSVTLPTANSYSIAAASGGIFATGAVTSATAQTWTNASVVGPLSIVGRLNLGSQTLNLPGAGATQLLNTASGGGANTLTGTINVTGSSLYGYAAAAGSAGGSDSLGTATVALSGTNPTLHFAPTLGTSLAGGTTPGLLAKGYQVGTTIVSLAGTNFLGASQAITNASGVVSDLTLPAGGGTVANLPTITSAPTFPLDTSYQFTGLLNITTAGMYVFSTTTDDGGVLFVDGNTPIATSVGTGAADFYLTAGLHVFGERINNVAGSGTVSVRYQGADTANALVDIPASAFFTANSASDLATTFANNITLAATTNATIDVSSDTTVNGTLTMIGSGAGTTLNVTGSGNLNTLTISGATALTDNLAIVTPTANLTLGGVISGTNFSITKSGFGTLTLGTANTYSGATSVTAGTLRLNNVNALQNSALSLSAGTVLQLRGNATATFNTGGTTTFLGSLTLDVDQLTAGNNNDVLTLGGNTSIAAGTVSVTGNTSATGDVLGLGPVTLTGAVVFNPTTASMTVASVTATNLGLTLGGSSTVNTVGAINIGTGAVTKNTAAGWILTGASSFTGGLTVQNGTLRVAGGDNRLPVTGNAVTLGSGTTSGKLIIGGDASGGTGVGTQHSQTLTQSAAASILSTSGTGSNNTVVGGADGGTSAGTPANNSILTLTIGTTFTDTYAGFIGGTGTFENNINLIKSGGGTLILSADFSNWTGIQTDAPNTNLAGDSTRPTLTVTGGVLQLNPGTVINTVILNTGGIVNDLGASYGSNYFIVTSGGLITLANTTASFESSGITAASHGVAALNIPGNTGVTDYAGSDVYLGAVGDRIFSGAALAVGSGATYRFGGGGPWNALGSATIGGSGGYLQVSTANVVTGTNNSVIIGDNGTYNSGSGIFGGLSTVEFTAAQNFTGTLDILGGTFQFTNVSQLGSPAVSTNSILLDGGAANTGYNAILRYGPSTTTDLSARIGIVSGGTIDTGANNVTFATAIGNANSGTGGLNKIGSGVLTLSQANTYAGPTAVSQGTLTLDFNQTGATTANILNSATGLAFNGGTTTVNAKGGSSGPVNSQNLVATNLRAGNNTLNLTTSAAISGTSGLNLALGLLTRSTGSGLNIVAGTNVTLNTVSGNATTTSLNTNGILSGGITTSGTGITGNTWAVSAASQATNVSWTSAGSTISGNPTNGTQVSFSGTAPSALAQNQAYYVVNSGAGSYQVSASLGGAPITLTDSGSTATVNIAGPISGLATGSYLTTVTAGNTAATYLTTSNVDVTSSPTIGGAININSLRFSSTATQTLTLATGTNIIGTGGILISSAVGNVATVLSGGTIEGSAGGDLIVNEDDASNNFTINSVIADNGTATGLTKNGAGTLVVTTATDTYSGQTVINAGQLTMDSTARYGNTTGFTLNGGQLNWTSTSNLAKLFTLGLNGGTLAISGGNNESIGTLGDVLAFQGSGARTLNLNNAGDRKYTFQFIIGDNGGPTSLSLTGSSDTAYTILNANNTYTGTTTINRGILQLASAGALPGGLGGIPVTTTNTGGGDLLFAATGTNRAILELTAASGGFFRNLGTGFDQVQWIGNGGFSNSTTSTIVVNLGGAGAGVTWGSGNFVPNGNILDFGQSAGNSNTSFAAIDFQNPINLGAAVRTIDVSNGTSTSVTGVDAILSGALTSITSGGLTKTGSGVLKLTANNAAGTAPNTATTVTTGYLLFAAASPTDTSAIPGTGTTNQTITIAAAGSAVLSGQSDPTALLNRVVTSSAGSVALDTNSSATLNFSSFSALGLGAYSDAGGTPIYFSGTILPNASTYRFTSAQLTAGGNTGPAASAVQADLNLLVLNRTNMLTDNGATPQSVRFGTGEFYLTGYNTYTGGTVVAGANGAGQIGVGNDAAFGIGARSVSPTVGGTGYFGALNGDHTLSNNITLGQAGNFVIAGNTASRGVDNYGAMTYLGQINLPATVSLFSEGTADAIVLGDLKPTGASTVVSYAQKLQRCFQPAADSSGRRGPQILYLDDYPGLRYGPDRFRPLPRRRSRDRGHQYHLQYRHGHLGNAARHCSGDPKCQPHHRRDIRHRVDCQCARRHAEYSRHHHRRLDDERYPHASGHHHRRRLRDSSPRPASAPWFSRARTPSRSPAAPKSSAGHWSWTRPTYKEPAPFFSPPLPSSWEPETTAR